MYFYCVGGRLFQLPRVFGVLKPTRRKQLMEHYMAVANLRPIKGGLLLRALYARLERSTMTRTRATVGGIICTRRCWGNSALFGGAGWLWQRCRSYVCHVLPADRQWISDVCRGVERVALATLGYKFIKITCTLGHKPVTSKSFKSKDIGRVKFG